MTVKCSHGFYDPLSYERRHRKKGGSMWALEEVVFNEKQPLAEKLSPQKRCAALKLYGFQEVLFNVLDSQ